jgi:hypothetical protein
VFLIRINFSQNFYSRTIKSDLMFHEGYSNLISISYFIYTGVYIGANALHNAEKLEMFERYVDHNSAAGKTSNLESIRDEFESQPNPYVFHFPS